jgi:medium-chain acyl-[acyl-carrier-protein] hydrolase
MGLIEKEKKKIACYECDATGKMLPTTAMNYFQELSTSQGDKLGIGGKFLNENKIAWFLVKYVIQFKNYPLYQEEISITTEAIGMDKFCAIRRFKILDANQELNIIALTQWLLVNRETQKMERVNQYKKFDAYECFEKGEPLFKNMKKITQVDLEKTFQVRFLDIDFNQHVNHVKYLEWAIEILPLALVKERDLKEVKIVYKAQSFYGDQVKARGQIMDNNHYRIDIVNQENSLLCQLELELN